jgi:hypothetical protein
LTGSTGKSLSGGTMSIEFKECAEHSGGNYKVCPNVKSEPLKLELLYGNSTRTGTILAAITPVKGQKIVTINCERGVAVILTGSLTAEVTNPATNKPVVVGSEPAEAKMVALT